MIIASIVSRSLYQLELLKYRNWFLFWKNNQVLLSDHYFSRRKWQLETKDIWLHYIRKFLRKILWATWHKTRMFPDRRKDYITHVSEEIEGRVTKRLSKEFSGTEKHILGPWARLDDFLMNPLLQSHSGTTPEASRNALSTSQGKNEDDSQNDPHRQAGLFHSQITQNSGPEGGHNKHILQPRFNSTSLSATKNGR